MRRRIPRLCASLGVILILASMTSGCGRRGRLLPPPDPDNPFALETKPAPAAQAQGTSGGTKTATNGTKGDGTKSGVHRRPSNPPILPPNQPFILDPLL